MRSSNAVFLGNARHDFRGHYDNSSKMQGSAAESANDADENGRASLAHHIYAQA